MVDLFLFVFLENVFFVLKHLSTIFSYYGYCEDLPHTSVILFISIICKNRSVTLFYKGRSKLVNSFFCYFSNKTSLVVLFIV